MPSMRSGVETSVPMPASRKTVKMLRRSAWVTRDGLVGPAVARKSPSHATSPGPNSDDNR